MSLISINFNDSQHKEIIMKLCKRNKFYEDDMYLELYRDFPQQQKKIFINLGINVKDKFDEIYNNICGNNTNYGYLMINKHNNRNSVVGFLIYNIESKNIRSDL